MYQACIAVVDASRARLFTFARSHDVDGPHEELVERHDLVNPARRLRPEQLFTDSRPGSSRVGGRQFAFDDHRSQNLAERDVAFSRDVCRELDELRRTTGAQRVILCASPRMLGALRRVGVALRRDGVELDEIARDLVGLTPPQLRKQLASYGMLPPS